MQIQKVLNSSVVLVADEMGREYILLGKGIGYGRKSGESIARQPSDRMFIPVTNPDAQPMLELFSTLPPVYLELTQEIVADAEAELGEKLSSHIYLSLTDHLNFAVERQKKNIVVTNRVLWGIKNFYSREFAVGLRGLTRAKEMLNVELPEEEAANIAFHIVNARLESGHDAMQATKLISNVSNIVMYSIHSAPSTDSINYSRFISHLQYFSERFFSGKLLKSEDDFLYHQMETAYPDAMTCAEKIRTFILKTYNVFLPNDEIAYLALHIARLSTAQE